MTNDVWAAFGNIATATGITAFALTGASGAVAGYQSCNSASHSLTESERKLERVRSRLKGLSPQRREEIEATQGNASGCKSLKDLEEQLEECVLLIDAVLRFKIHGGSLDFSMCTSDCLRGTKRQHFRCAIIHTQSFCNTFRSSKEMLWGF
jgi:hypothetical protein